MGLNYVATHPQTTSDFTILTIDMQVNRHNPNPKPILSRARTRILQCWSIIKYSVKNHCARSFSNGNKLQRSSALLRNDLVLFSGQFNAGFTIPLSIFISDISLVAASGWVSVAETILHWDRLPPAFNDNEFFVCCMLSDLASFVYNNTQEKKNTGEDDTWRNVTGEFTMYSM